MAKERSFPYPRPPRLGRKARLNSKIDLSTGLQKHVPATSKAPEEHKLTAS